MATKKLAGHTISFGAPAGQWHLPGPLCQAIARPFPGHRSHMLVAGIQCYSCVVPSLVIRHPVVMLSSTPQTLSPPLPQVVSKWPQFPCLVSARVSCLPPPPASPR